jgi:hypothetical protein
VGWEVPDFRAAPWVWSASTGKTQLIAPPSPAPSLGIDGGYGERINDQGEVCLYQADGPNNALRSYFWSHSTDFIRLGDPTNGVVPNAVFICHGLNNAGVIAGTAFRGPGLSTPPTPPSPLVFTWSRSGGFRALTMDESTFADAEDINDAGVVVGRMGLKPALWTAQNQLVLLSADGAPGVAYALNEYGIVVGVSSEGAVAWVPHY